MTYVLRGTHYSPILASRRQGARRQALFVFPQTAPDARLSGQSIGATTLREVDYSPSAPIA